jgi:hypothetical protein
VWVEVAYDIGVFYAPVRQAPLPLLLPCVSWPEAYVQARNEPDPGPELATALRANALVRMATGEGGDAVMPDKDEPE